MTKGAAADSGVAAGGALVAFAEAVVLGEDAGAAPRAVLDALGPAALVDAAAVVASFNSVVRIADACGVPLESFKVDEAARIVDEIGWKQRDEG